MTTEAPADEEKEREAGATDGKATVVRTRAKLALQAGELVRIARAVLERSWRAGAILAGLTVFLQSLLRAHPTFRASIGSMTQRACTWASQEVPVAGWLGLAATLVVVGTPSLRAWLRSLRSPARTLAALAWAAIFLGAYLLLVGGGGSWFPAVVAVIAATFWGASRLAVENDRQVAVGNVDMPISSIDQDLFQRDALVTRCAAYLTSTTIRCPRVALLAKVGMGKTSVANLLRERLEKEGHLFARFDPWHHENREDLFSALMATVDDALVHQSIHSGLFARQRTVLRDWLRGVLGGNSWVSGFRLPVESRLAISQAELADRIRESLGPDRRLIIFVDDLERCSKATVLRMLVDTREVVDAPGISYLYAIDDSRIEVDEDDAQWLLQKIFDLQLGVPEPHPTELAELDRQILTQLGAPSLETSLLDLQSALPGSPRERKRFITQVVSWPVSITKAPGGMSATLLLSLLLLEFRAQGSLSFVARNELVMTDLQTGAFRQMVTGPRGGKEEEGGEKAFPDAPWAESAEGGEAYALAQGIGSDVRDVRSHVEWLLTGRLSPRQQLVRLLRDVIGSAAGLQDLLDVRGNVARASAQDMQSALIQLRALLVSEAADVIPRAEQDRLLGRAVLVSEARMKLLEMEPDSLRDQHLFQMALGGLLRFANFGGIYGSAHEAEGAVLQKMARAAPKFSLRLWDEVEQRTHGGLDYPAQQSCIVALREILKPQAAARLVEMLPAGTILTTKDTTYERQRELLLDPDGPFHDSDLRKQLKQVLQDVEVAQPAWDAARRVWETFVDAAERGHGGARRLAEDQEWVEMVWGALTRHRINRRMAGSLEKSVQRLAGAVERACAPPMPKWWDDVMAETERPWQPVASEDREDESSTGDEPEPAGEDLQPEDVPDDSEE